MLPVTIGSNYCTILNHPEVFLHESSERIEGRVLQIASRYWKSDSRYSFWFHASLHRIEQAHLRSDRYVTDDVSVNSDDVTALSVRLLIDGLSMSTVSRLYHYLHHCIIISTIVSMVSLKVSQNLDFWIWILKIKIWINFFLLLHQ